VQFRKREATVEDKARREGGQEGGTSGEKRRTYVFELLRSQTILLIFLGMVLNKIGGSGAGLDGLQFLSFELRQVGEYKIV
jgi:hypothetical protein